MDWAVYIKNKIHSFKFRCIKNASKLIQDNAGHIITLGRFILQSNNMKRP